MMEQLRRSAEAYGIALTAEHLESFRVYLRMLLEWNERMNLTSITEESEILRKHFLDSLLLLDAWDFPVGAGVMDIGSGAGFPGVPLKICRPDLDLTLLDSLGKRVSFLEALAEALGLSYTALHGRAEECAHEPGCRESRDIVTARAVAPLPKLCELCLGFVKVGGVFLAMKGPDAQTELEAATKAIETLGGAVCGLKEYGLPRSGRRSILLIRKISQTPTAYPRTSKKMSKKPL